MDRKVGFLTVRELVGVGLLLGILMGGLLSGWYMGRQNRALSQTMEQTGWMALSGQWSNARQTARKAKEDWEESRQIRAALGDHGPMEEIDNLFGELTVYAAAGEQTEFAKTCAALASRLEALSQASRLNGWNVL